MRYTNTWLQESKLPLFTLIAFLMIATTGLQAKLVESDPLPDLSEFVLVGDLPDMDGKVVLIDFWASWCAPCKASFPEMDKLYQEFKDKGVVILGVGVDSTQKAHDKFAEKSGVSFPLVHDAEKKLVAAAAIEVMPTSLMIDKSGNIRYIHKGYYGKETINSYREEIKSLLAE